MQITIGLLEDHGVCENQRQVFATEWPKGCTVTLAVARRAAELGLDLEWAANNLLCAQARSQFVEAVAPARRVYDEAMAPALRVYVEAVAPARRVHDKAVAPARRVHDKALATASRVYDEERACAFVAACDLHDSKEH